MHVAQSNQVTHQVWADRLEQAPGPQKYRDGGTLGTCTCTLHRHFYVLIFYRYFNMFGVFVTASVRLGCARVSRQHRLGGSERRLLKEYPVEWITVHVGRGTRMSNSAN